MVPNSSRRSWVSIIDVQIAVSQALGGTGEIAQRLDRRHSQHQDDQGDHHRECAGTNREAFPGIGAPCCELGAKSTSAL